MPASVREEAGKTDTSSTQVEKRDLKWAKEVLAASEIPLWYTNNVPRKRLDPLYVYAFDQFNARRYELALTILQGLIVAEFHHFDYHYAAGLCHWHLRQLPYAMLRFGVAMQLAVQDPRPYFYVFKILVALQEYETATHVGVMLGKLIAKDESMVQMRAEVKRLMRQLKETDTNDSPHV